MKLSLWTQAAVISGFVLLTGPALAAAVSENQLIASEAKLVADPKTGKARFIGFDAKAVAKQMISAESQRVPAEAVAAKYLSDYGTLFGLRDTAKETRPLKHRLAEDGSSTTRYQQNFQGLPVIGGQLVVNQTAQRQISSISGRTSPDLELDTTPTITPVQAMAIARKVMAKWYQLATGEFAVPPPILSIYDPSLLSPSTQPVALVWQMEVGTQNLHPIREFIVINAKTGGIELHFNQVPHAKNRLTYDAGNNLGEFPGKMVCDESNPTCQGAGADAVYAHTYSSNTYDFYLKHFGRDGIDGKGIPIKSTVNYCEIDNDCPYMNAAWMGDKNHMIYGKGFTKAEDIVAHELTHGVTEYESNLYYYAQSGAINESLSDVFGEFVQQSNPIGTVTPATRWLMGEDLEGIGAGRNMSNPPLFRNPDRMKSPYYHLAASDSYGVHINSGVNNKAAYLMVDGGTFNGRTVAAVGLEKAAQIYYRVQTNFLVSGSDYLDLYNALNQSCQDLIGTVGINAADCQSVRNATEAVEMNQEPLPGLNPKAAQCSAGQRVDVTLFSDDLESDYENWDQFKKIGEIDWQINSYFVASGKSALHGYADDQTTDFSVVMASGVTLPANAQLWFKHAFMFETDYSANHDGGVLEYSTNGGSSWTDAGGLFAQGKDYGGALYSGNPLAGRKAFVGQSLGYVSSRYDLSSLVGKNVQFRWRVGTDSGVATMGWFVDDVSIHSCAADTMTVPAAPTNVVATAGNASVTLAFNAPASSGGAAITGYSATCSSAAGVKAAYGATSPITVNGLANDQAYSCVVQALNPLGSSTASAPVVVKPLVCSYAINGQSATLGASANYGNVLVTASGDSEGARCAWTARKILPADWLSVTSGYAYLGTASVSFSAQANPSPAPRTGEMEIAGHTFTVLQEGLASSLSGLTVDKFGNGRVTSEPAGIDCGSTCTASFSAGALVTLTAAPDAGETFTGWQGACTGQSLVCKVALSEAQTATARFSAVNASCDNSIDSDGDGIPDCVENTLYTQPHIKDNDIFQDPKLFAMQQYRDFLGYEGADKGVASLANRIDGNIITHAQAIYSFFDVAEFKNTSPALARLYFAYFLRAPDYNGLMYWIGQNKGGKNLHQISESFALSQEFGQRYGNLDNEQFVTLIYHNVLERAPDANGKAYWLDRMNHGGLTRGALMVGFSESTEYMQTSAHKTNLALLYAHMLRRSPDQASFDNGVASLNSGKPLLNLIDELMSSAEYYQRFLP